MKMLERKFYFLNFSFENKIYFYCRKYLLGFRKRKDERKKVARKELEEKIREEKKNQRELVRNTYLFFKSETKMCFF
jgi:hypothetical protein